MAQAATAEKLLMNTVCGEVVGFAFRMMGCMSMGGARCASLPLATSRDPSGTGGSRRRFYAEG